MALEIPPATGFAPPKDIHLLALIRAKRECHWKPSLAELKKGFRGWHQRGFLPHFDAPGITQFVTVQLHDSFPAAKNLEFAVILKHPDDSEKRRKIEQWLDRGYGECWLAQDHVAQIVENVLLEKQDLQYLLRAWVIMPNHIHFVVDVWETPLSKLIQAWKGKSSRFANARLRRGGPFWQRDYFDTRIRDEAHLRRTIQYVENNPTKAFLAKTPREWRWSSARYRDEYERLNLKKREGVLERDLQVASTSECQRAVGDLNVSSVSSGEAT
jgi:putative transposase